MNLYTEEEKQGYKDITAQLESITNKHLTAAHVHAIAKNESIEEFARLSFESSLNYNAITPAKLLEKFMYLSIEDDYYYTVRGLVLECKRLIEQGKLYIDEYIKGDLDYIGNCPEHVEFFTPADAVKLIDFRY